MGEPDRQHKAGAQRGRPRTDDRDDPVIAGLRQLWASVENEPVPDDFLALLKQIEQGPAEISDEEAGR